MAGDLLFFLGGDDLDFVWSQAEEAEAVGDGSADRFAVFADAARENEQIDAAKERNAGAYDFADGGDEGVECELRAGIIFGGAILQGFHVAFAAGKSVQTAFVVDQVFDLVGGEIFCAQKVEDHAGIKITAAGAHGDAAGGSEAHGGVDGLAVA